MEREEEQAVQPASDGEDLPDEEDYASRQADLPAEEDGGNPWLMIRRRPRKGELTPQFVFWCASHLISQEVIGELFGITQPAISQRFAREPLRSAWRAGRAAAKANLHAAQYRNAVVKDNPVAQIWLGKNYLDQKDAPHTLEQNVSVEVRYLAEWGGGELTAPEVPLEIEAQAVEDETEEDET
jgi:hypothetical protein